MPSSEQLPLVPQDSLQQQLSSYHEQQRARQQLQYRSKCLGRVIVGFVAASLISLFLGALVWPAPVHYERTLDWKSILDAHDFSGVVRLSTNGQKIFQMAKGLANVPFMQPMEEQSVFSMGTHVQLLVAVAMLQLQERGLVDLRQSVSTYWDQDDWRKFGLDTNRTTWCPTVANETACQVVTYHDLLYMGSGFETQERDKPLQTMMSFATQVGTFIDQPLAFKPGTSFKYADENYVLLAFMVEKLSGVTLKQYLTRYIFDPLLLTSTTFVAFGGAVDVKRSPVNQYVQFYAYRQAAVGEREHVSGNRSSNSSSGFGVVSGKHLSYMSTGSCAIYKGLENSLYGLQSTAEDMHEIYTDLFHEQGRHSKLLKTHSVALMVRTRNPAYPAFGLGIGVDFEKQPREAARESNWPAKITFCGSTTCSRTCMAMQMPVTNLSIVASAFTNNVRLYFTSIDAFHAFEPRDFIQKQVPTTEKSAFEMNDGAANAVAWSLLQFFSLVSATSDN
uniref:Beta-lactamase-related domain-containing protein n=1 Tax=Peronospora matthiolae TaxID=2874970 RepID=A0AAV1UMK1_9STRA